MVDRILVEPLIAERADLLRVDDRQLPTRTWAVDDRDQRGRLISLGRVTHPIVEIGGCQLAHDISTGKSSGST